MHIFISIFFFILLYFLQAARNGVADLVDRHLGALYPQYLESTRAVLVRQARDLLVCTFHGDLSRFEREFLSPAAKLIEVVKCTSCNLSVSKHRRLKKNHFTQVAQPLFLLHCCGTPIDYR